MDLLKTLNWSFRRFIKEWIGVEGRDDKFTHHAYGTKRSRRTTLIESLLDPVVQEEIGDRLPGGQASKWVSSIKMELENLIGRPYFGVYDDHTTVEDVDFAVAFGTIKEEAPTWCALLLAILPNSRAHRDSYPSDVQIGRIEKLVYTITSMVLHSRGRDRSNFFCKMMDRHYVNTGAKRRLIETMSGFGICESYTAVNRLPDGVAEQQKLVPYPHNIQGPTLTSMESPTPTRS